MTNSNDRGRLSVKAVYLQEQQLAGWDAFVASHPDGTIYHRSDWKRVLENAYPHLNGHVLVLLDADSDAILAGMPIYEAKSYLLGSRLVCAPASTWCDPLVSNQAQLERLLEEVRRLALRRSSTRV